jgi:hypothetical protein
MPLSVGDKFAKEEKNMKYVISWFERPQGSPIEYENAQKRILDRARHVQLHLRSS